MEIDQEEDCGTLMSSANSDEDLFKSSQENGKTTENGDSQTTSDCYSSKNNGLSSPSGSQNKGVLVLCYIGLLFLC